MVVDVQVVVVVLTLSHRSGDPYQKGGCGGDKDEGSRALVPVNGTQVHTNTNRHKQAQKLIENLLNLIILKHVLYHVGGRWRILSALMCPLELSKR